MRREITEDNYKEFPKDWVTTREYNLSRVSEIYSWVTSYLSYYDLLNPMVHHSGAVGLLRCALSRVGYLCEMGMFSEFLSRYERMYRVAISETSGYPVCNDFVPVERWDSRMGNVFVYSKEEFFGKLGDLEMFVSANGTELGELDRDIEILLERCLSVIVATVKAMRDGSYNFVVGYELTNRLTDADSVFMNAIKRIMGDGAVMDKYITERSCRYFRRPVDD